MIWSLIFIVLGMLLVATVPLSIVYGDPIWPWSLVLGASSLAFGMLIRWRGWA